MIRNIRLKNFKAFADIDIELSQLTLLTGVNSAGKTSVTQSLVLLWQSLPPSGIADSHDSTLVLNGDYLHLGQGRDVRHENWDSADDPEGRIVLEVSDGDNTASMSASYLADSDVLPAIIRGSRTAESLINGRPGMFQYISADRMPPATSYPRSYAEVVTKRRLGSRGEYAVSYLNEFQDEPIAMEDRAHSSQNSLLLLAQVEAWLGEVQPGIAVEVSDFAGLDSARLAFQAGRTGIGSSNSYRPTHVGFGISFVLPVIVACLATPPGGLIIVENPESHLHPRAQSALGALLARTAASGTQVVVESHSDHILNSLRFHVKSQILAPADLSLQYFSRREGSIVVSSPKVNANGRLDAWPDGFFDEWETSTLQLLG